MDWIVVILLIGLILWILFLSYQGWRNQKRLMEYYDMMEAYEERKRSWR